MLAGCFGKPGMTQAAQDAQLIVTAVTPVAHAASAAAPSATVAAINRSLATATAEATVLAGQYTPGLLDTQEFYVAARDLLQALGTVDGLPPAALGVIDACTALLPTFAAVVGATLAAPTPKMSPDQARLMLRGTEAAAVTTPAAAETMAPPPPPPVVRSFARDDDARNSFPCRGRRFRRQRAVRILGQRQGDRAGRGREFRPARGALRCIQEAEDRAETMTLRGTRMDDRQGAETEEEEDRRLEADARAMGCVMAHEGFPRSVPFAFVRFGAAWLAGYDGVMAAVRGETQ